MKLMFYLMFVGFSSERAFSIDSQELVKSWKSKEGSYSCIKAVLSNFALRDAGQSEATCETDCFNKVELKVVVQDDYCGDKNKKSSYMKILGLQSGWALQEVEDFLLEKPKCRDFDNIRDIRRNSKLQQSVWVASPGMTQTFGVEYSKDGDNEYITTKNKQGLRWLETCRYHRNKTTNF